MRNVGFFMHNRGRYFVQQQTPAGPIEPSTFVEFDGVNQYARNTDTIAAAVFPGGPAPNNAFTFCFWHRGTDNAASAAVKRFKAITCTSEANDASSFAYVRTVDLTVHRLTLNRIRTTPSVALAQRLYNQTSWPDGTFSSPSAWRFAACIYTATSSIIWERGAFRPNTSASTWTDYNNAIGKYFALNGSISSANVLTTGSTLALQYRAPSLWLSALNSTQLAAIEAAGPQGNQSAANGWWPGDNDTYPTWRNKGIAGATWDLTLVNGSQSMFKAT
jgi:hypothetical protein